MAARSSEANCAESKGFLAREEGLPIVQVAAPQSEAGR